MPWDWLTVSVSPLTTPERAKLLEASDTVSNPSYGLLATPVNATVNALGVMTPIPPTTVVGSA